MSVSIIVIALSLMSLSVMNRQDQKTIGIREGYDCLTSGGYSWDDTIGACSRVGELDESQRQAAKLAVAPLSYPVTIVKVQTLRCPGCFIVDLQRNDNQNIFQIELFNWTYKIDCEEYPYDNCPERCVVCPSCEFCSSISCQTEESCESLGFSREWYENITKLLDEQH